jgi:hypothetical protein
LLKKDFGVKRLTLVLALVLALGLAVPASAVTWRGYADVRADRGSFAYAGGTANNVTDIRLGIYTYSTGRTVYWEALFTCVTGPNLFSREKSGNVTTTAGTWKWILIRDGSAAQDYCDFDAFVEPPAGVVRMKVQVS